MRWFLCQVLFFSLHIIVSCKSCYWNTKCPSRHFSSKTPYDMVRGDIRDSVIKLKDCEPVSMWVIMRHGKRNPGSYYGKWMKEALAVRDFAISSYEKGNSSLCAQDVENLKNWVPADELFGRPGELSQEGYQEMVGVGRRLKQAFPKFFAQLEKGNCTFRSVSDKRGDESIKGFVQGLGNKNISVDKSIDGYDYIAPYSTCGKYVRDIRFAPYVEVERYMKTSEYLTFRERIHRRLGIDFNLTYDNITAIWDLCRYSSSGLPLKFSPWCALLTEHDLEVMEYIGDLRHYYRNAYGIPNDMSKTFGQIVLVDLLKRFQDAIEGRGNKITAYVTHATMMDMIFTALGLFKDESPLTGDVRDPDRKWNVSKFSVFANNLIAVLNKCSKGDDDYKVSFYLKEEPLKELCNEGVCSWRELENMLRPFLKTNLDFCEYTLNSKINDIGAGSPDLKDIMKSHGVH